MFMSKTFWFFAVLVFFASFSALVGFLVGGRGVGILCFLATCFVAVKIGFANSFFTDPRTILFLGMPVLMVVIHFILLFLIVFIGTPSDQLQEVVNLRFRAFSFALFLGWITGILHWYLFSPRITKV